MNGKSTSVAVAYAVVGVVALIGMWLNVGLFLVGPDPSINAFVGALFGNPIATMLSIEMACMAMACSLFMYREARRLQLPAWLILVLAVTLGFGGVVPLFLAWRERRGA